ncbi:hypothetical protein C1645_766381 [Glomus cerebriforme]|uniref:TNFR-Cys domain-containing protein n=1 Tax=Glomus cerebriforme TaxID=658196 RepID=A0A397T3E1_9GLOM|nr:hypothetical protein C1645_766381 [Glomus cerebriforme]
MAISNLSCSIIISMAIFFGVFFGVNYPEIKRSEYIPTICQSLSATFSPRFCCDLKCTCDNAKSGLPECESLVFQSQSLSTVACEQNSTLCPKSGSDAFCYNDCSIGHYKNCAGCRYVTHESCNMNCGKCYDIKLNVIYNVDRQQQNSTYTQNFKSIDDAKDFLTDHKPNKIFWCYYNPSSVTEVILNRNFTSWKWVIFAFSSLPLFVSFIVLTNHVLCNYIDDYTWRWSVVFFIWIGIILPLIILLEVWEYGPVFKTGLKVLMVFILFFVALGSLPLVIKFLISCEFTRLQIIILSFMGLIIPLVMYIPIILYVPSSIKIGSYILIIQLVLVLLTIISNRISLKASVLKNIMYL